MLRRFLVLSVVMVAMVALASCAGDDGAVGPAGPAGTDAAPRAIRVLVLGSEFSELSLYNTVLGLRGDGGFNPSTTVDSLNVRLAVPPLSALTPYNVVFFYVNGTPADTVGVGDLLANYIDAGGKVVIGQGALTFGFGLGGRFITPGYSPLATAGPSGDGNDRVFDTSTIDDPSHDVFRNLNPNSFVLPGNPFYTDNPLVAGSTVIARWQIGHIAIAENANSTVMAVNVFPSSDEQDVLRLVGNALHYLANAW